MKEFRYSFRFEKIKDATLQGENITGIKVTAFDKIAKSDNDHYYCAFEVEDNENTDKIIMHLKAALTELFIKIEHDNKAECIDFL